MDIPNTDDPARQVGIGPDSSRGDLQEANRRLIVAGLRAQRDAEDSDRSLAQLNALISELAEGMVVLDEKGQIVLLNPAAHRIIGANDGNLADVEMRPIDRRSLDRDGTWPGAPIARALRGEEFTDVETILDSNESQRRVVFSANCLRDDEGRVQLSILTCRDVTQLRELEKVREEFVALVSHDLRSPLSIVLGASRRLAQQLDQDHGGEMAEMVALIGSNAERMQDLIDDLLESSYLESGKLRLEEEPVALVPLVRELLSQGTLQHAGRVQIVAPETMMPILGDSARLQRVVRNLLDNAFKYSDETSPIEITLESGADEVVLTVRDEGRGISAEDLPHLFERFHRVGLSQHAKGSYGLGLYISRLIIEAHGGRIWVESELDVGSTFGISLPTGNLER